MTTEFQLGTRLAFRPNEAAAVIGASRDTIFTAISSGALRSFKIGAARYISREALIEFIRKLEAGT
jgi:excisionase family DNA binding protein